MANFKLHLRPSGPDGLAAPAPAEPDPPQSSWYEDCVNFKGDALTGGWNSAKDNVKFPTVESIMADMTAYENIGRGPNIFYSFGVPTVQLDKPRARTVMAQGIATALAKLSKGEVFFVVKNHKGDHGGEGVYQLPETNDNLINVWRDYEYPALQRNP
ncbi:hypothetical protein SLS53_007379 [Cytospora paraplurivora]|uniref:Uncharacterized protein n=1 Tax=Cytospora paraplurivora TaxID=2898453 RepID=A0AAN9U092_9PEZI